MPYNRPWKDRADQIVLLQSRGLDISDADIAKECLAKIGYYRLSGYWYSFRELDANRKVTDQFKPDAKFSDAVDLYIFDKKLRLLALDALERIEVAIRVEIAHTLGARDTFAHQNGSHLDGSFTKRKGRYPSRHENWLNRYTNLLSQSKEDFVDHYQKTHGLPLPIWVSIEIWDFGAMSLLYSGMQRTDRDNIAQKFNAPDGRYLASWLRSLNYLRNICAHHSRLWNRNILEQPKIPPVAQAGDLIQLSSNKMIARSFLLFCILQTLMREICPNSQWHERFKQHMTSFPNISSGHCSLLQMGCPEHWEGWSLWT